MDRYSYVKKIIALTLTLCLLSSGTAVFAADDSTTITRHTYEDNVYVTRVYIGPEITHIDEDSFLNLHKLWLIQVDEGNPYYSTYANCLYNKDQTKLICFPFALSRTKLPETVREVGLYALKGKCDHVKKKIESAVKKNRGE